jgi:hypothetical protein
VPRKIGCLRCVFLLLAILVGAALTATTTTKAFVVVSVSILGRFYFVL